MISYCIAVFVACLTLSSALIIKTGGSTGRGVLTSQQYEDAMMRSSRRHRNPATGMLGAYNYDGQTYTSTEFMSIRMPYQADGGKSSDYASAGLEYARVIPGYRRNQHLWTGDHQNNYKPIRDIDGWVRRYSTDRDEYRRRLHAREEQEDSAGNVAVEELLQNRRSSSPVPAAPVNVRANRHQNAQKPAQWVQQPQQTALDPMSDRVNIVTPRQSNIQPSNIQPQNQFVPQQQASWGNSWGNSWGFPFGFGDFQPFGFNAGNFGNFGFGGFRQ